ncbi:MAG: hypothetical protein B6D39_11455 [Anaerolineae bacterium UTCFX2]|jgi:hypothetical protein|nr:hypothetical protein [Anaerolineales bacterium]OQY88312.1 MAG: hypothetical protein B6D39_11455 [Anaerolineae bacterium UTCFX2]
MDYAEVLSRSWKITWKHKALWIFGILSGCTGSSGGGGGGSSKNTGDANFQQILPESWQRAFDSVPAEAWTAIIIAAICLVLILVVIGIFLSTIGTIGLIHGAALADRDLEARLPFGTLFRGSLPYFWRVFLLHLLIGILVFIVFAAGVVVAILGTVVTLGIGLICLLPLICLLIPLAIVVNVIINQATIAIVTEDLGIFAGLQRGWEVVRDNPGPIAVVWLVLDLGVRFIGGLILSLPLLFALAPLFIALLSGTKQALGTGAIVSGVLVVCYLPFLVILSGVLVSYVQSGWTLTFRRLTEPPEDSPEHLLELTA